MTRDPGYFAFSRNFVGGDYMRYLDIVRQFEQHGVMPTEAFWAYHPQDTAPFDNHAVGEHKLPKLKSGAGYGSREYELSETSLFPQVFPGTQVTWQSPRFGERVGRVVLTAGEWVLVQALGGVGTVTFVHAQWLRSMEDHARSDGDGKVFFSQGISTIT